MAKIGTVDPLSLLERKDKWFLGGGKGAIYAPPFPRWLEKPGFWDECYFADIRLTRLFTILFTDFDGKPIRFRGELKSWRPDRMILEHRAEGTLIRETRQITEEHEWISVFELLSGDAVHVFVWAMPEQREPGYGTPWQSLSSCAFLDNAINYRISTAWPREVEADRTGIDQERLKGSADLGEPIDLLLQLGTNRPRVSFTVNLAQWHDDAPLWETSLLPQKLRNGKLPGDTKLIGGPPPFEGFVHIVQQYELLPNEPLVVTCRAALNGFSSREPTFPGPAVIEQNEKAWRSYFRSVPQFESSDPYLTAAYWYRWYGIRLNTVDIPDLPICTSSAEANFSPFVTEGVGFFRNFVTYSAQAHLREVAWMHSPKLGLGILENLAKCQRADGSYPGHNYSGRPARDFYHADFATGLESLHAIHQIDLEEPLQTFFRYADYFFGHRVDRDGVLIFDQNETGQEYMSRYQFASGDADLWASFQVIGVDATYYLFELLTTLARFSPATFHAVRSPEADLWGDRVASLRQNLTDLFDRDNRYFCDKIPGSDALSPIRPATGLYPLMHRPLLVDARDGAQESIACWLTQEGQFWLPKGFPATALSDPTFSAEPEWKDKRLNCPWNGRSWPMVNSHLVDAIANVARRLRDETLRKQAGDALVKAITLMFHDGDSARPNSYEHYDPIKGTPSLYRGYDDYMHSWIVDLIMLHAVGVQPGTDEVDPLPLGVEWIECSEIPHPEGRMRVRIERDQVVNITISAHP